MVVKREKVIVSGIIVIEMGASEFRRRVPAERRYTDLLCVTMKGGLACVEMIQTDGTLFRCTVCARNKQHAILTVGIGWSRHRINAIVASKKPEIITGHKLTKGTKNNNELMPNVYNYDDRSTNFIGAR